MKEELEGLGEAFERMEADADVIRAAYQALPREWLKAALLVEYRCPNKRGCLLLHAWRGDGGETFFHVPHYKMSPARNDEQSVESARRKHTLDGDRVWRPRAGVLDHLKDNGPNVGIGVQCDHLLPVTVSAADVLGDVTKATRGRPHKRTITARLA